MLSSKYQKLTPFIQDFVQDDRKISLLQVGGRLLNADRQYDAEFPFLLPANTRFGYLYIKHLHLSNYHCGAKILIALLRQRIWIINSRNLAKKSCAKQYVLLSI